jgi:hypothetical protein
MEEQVSHVGGMMRDVVAAQRASLARVNVLAQIRLRPPVRRSLPRRLLTRGTSHLPRLRFVLPTLAAAGLCAAWWVSRPMPLTFAVVGADTIGAPRADSRGAVGAPLVAPSDGRLPLNFSDGSTMNLDRGTRARVMSLDARGATVRLEQGRADVSVRHRRDTRWQLQAGSFEVTVTGTRFSIGWNDRAEDLTVVMAEGTVEVRGGRLAAGSPVVVTTGQRFHASSRESRWTLAASSEPELAPVAAPADPTAVNQPQVDAPSEAPAPPALPPLARGPAGGSRAWQTLARAGRYPEALREVEHTGFEGACRKLGADDLVQLGDVARLARNAPRAEQAYQTARRRFPASDRPAFALGLIAFEQRRDFQAAGNWFNLYVRRYPKGALVSEALGREMESWHRAGEAARARRAARAYLSQATSGPYAPLARQIVAP